MARIEESEVQPKKKISKKIIIPIILFIALILSVSGLFVYSKVTNKPIKEIFTRFAPEEKELTIPLEEFLVNLNSEYGDSKQYLRIKMTLMYMDEKESENIQANISLIRDIIISRLRDVTLENVLKEETMVAFKGNAVKSINDRLGMGLIKEIYITDLIVK